MGVWDNPAGLEFDVPALKPVDIGTDKNRLGTVYAKRIEVTDPIVEEVVLPNDTYLKSVDAAGTGTVNLIKANAFDETIVSAKGFFGVYDPNLNADILEADNTGVTGANFKLSDSSPNNYATTVYAAGTAYQLTNTAAKIDFGTTDPAILFSKAGVFLLLARVNVKYNGATFAAPRDVTIKIRKTSGTPADVTGSSTTATTAIVTTVTNTFQVISLPPVLFTAAANDQIELYGSVSVVPSAGSIDVVEASIVAVRLYAT